MTDDRIITHDIFDDHIWQCTDIYHRSKPAPLLCSDKKILTYPEALGVVERHYDRIVICLGTFNAYSCRLHGDVDRSWHTGHKGKGRAIRKVMSRRFGLGPSIM
jgi:hypothetical protein